jgi:hypothetical protein
MLTYWIFSVIELLNTQLQLSETASRIYRHNNSLQQSLSLLSLLPSSNVW